ncbi:hypothetical protein [Paenibacillus oralis]|uniref:hypothetical protein n=2 Tax=Paenibacillus TaxID=44249 RepID=UPI0015ADF18A|nr:hypothetical protein [Paenibacillus oralis]
MASEKTYHALIPDKIFMGAATDVESMVKNEGIDVIVDLRGEATELFICTDCRSNKSLDAIGRRRYNFYLPKSPVYNLNQMFEVVILE